jgi:hypothetical protein
MVHGGGGGFELSLAGWYGRHGRLAIPGCPGTGIGRVPGMKLLGENYLQPGSDRDGHQGAYQAQDRAADQGASSTAAALMLTVCRRMRGAMR